MAMKNYYAVLGISRNETPAGIRAAYRDAARRTHPDHAGPGGAAEFQEIVEAHSVLSDPNRRREYNDTLSSHERELNPVETLRNFWPASFAQSIFADAHAVHPSFEALSERLMRNFTGWHVPKAEKPEPLSIEVILTPEEVARGGVLSLGIPVYQVCPTCGGTGSDWLFPCLDCAGEGTASRLHPIRVRVPQWLRPGSMSEVSLQALGITNLFLNLRFRVSTD